MALCPAQVTSRSNTDLGAILAVAQNTALRPEERMALITATVKEWDRNTEGSTGRGVAERIHERYYPFGVRRP
jgi:S-adenosylmethionine synthetase